MSVSPSEIRGNASQIHRLTNEVNSTSKKLQSDYTQSSSYWTGTASKAFQSEYNALDSEMKNLLRMLDRLEGGVQRVASEVNRAEQEREEKRRLAEKAAQEALKQKQLEKQKQSQKY